MSMTDTNMLPLAIGGNTAALSRLLKRHAASVRGVLSGRIPRRWRSVLSEDDILQQTFADASRDIRHFTGDTDQAFDAWLCRIAECNLYDAVRMLDAEKRGGGRRRAELPGTGDSHQDLLHLLTAGGSTPLRHTSDAEVRSVLDRGIDQLPEVYGTVIRMMDLDGRSVADVAAAIGRSRGAVHMLRARGHERLRQLLGDTTNFFGGSV